VSVEGLSHTIHGTGISGVFTYNEWLFCMVNVRIYVPYMYLMGHVFSKCFFFGKSGMVGGFFREVVLQQNELGSM